MKTFEEIMEPLADGVRSRTVVKMETFEEVMEYLADGISSRTVEDMETFFVSNGVTHKAELTPLETSLEVENGNVGVPKNVIVKHGSSIEEIVGLEHGGEVENVSGSVSEVEMNGEKGVENVKVCGSSMVFVDTEKFDGMASDSEVNKNAENDPENKETSNGLSVLVDIAVKDGKGLNDKAYLKENGGFKTLKKSKYNAGDFVWGKIKNYPWWPAQIFDPSDASELALKHQRMNRLLVAYSRDGTFAWCKPSQLKPFHENYVIFSKRSNKKSLAFALQLALEQIGELVEWNMTCSCALKQNQIKLSRPITDNSGLKNGLLMPINGQSKLNQFEPTQILADLKHLSQVVSVDNMLDLILMRSKLSAFYRAKGGYQLPVYYFPQNIIGLEDNNPNIEKVDVPNQTDEFMSVPSSLQICERMNIAAGKLFSSPSPLFKCSAEKHKTELSNGPDVEIVTDSLVTKASPKIMLSELCDTASGHLYKRVSDKKRKFAGSESNPNATESISVQKRSKKHEPNAPGSPAALLMTFSPGVSLPTKDDLIERYREFGSLEKEKTNVMVNSSCAQVVFVSTEDAEQAYNHSISTKQDDTITYTIRYLSHGSNALELDNNKTSESPSIKSMKQELEMITSVVENSDCNISEEMRNNLVGKLKTLSDKVSKM